MRTASRSSRFSGAGIILAGLLFLTGCGDLGSNSGTPADVTATPAKSIAETPGKDQKTCFECRAKGITSCRARGCQAGKVECPGPCLKLTRGRWVRLNVPGHDPKELWQQFKGRAGTKSWSQGHVGEVVVMQNGDFVNIGACTVCGGTTKVGCKSCGGQGTQECEICSGKKFIPIAWTPTDNPWLNKQPDLIRLTDGRVFLGRIAASSGDDRTIVTREGKAIHANVSEIVSKPQ